MMSYTHARALSSFLLVLTPAVASAENPAQWTIVEQINRGDVTKTWTSPTPVDLNKMVWVYDLEITKLTGTVNLGIFGDVTQDITSSIPPEQRAAIGETRDLPAVLSQEMLVEPESGTSADVLVELDTLGFGQAVFSNIVLGSIDVPLFGSRPIQRINIEASVSVTGFDYGDFNRDANVDSADYVLWRKTLFQAGSLLPADGDNSGVVDVVDYGIWQENFGRQPSTSSASAAVPEPTTSFVSILLLFAVSVRSRQR